jgi:hypothetical protein
MTTLTSDTQSGAVTPIPVAPLAYADPHERWPAEIRLLVGVAIVVSVINLLGSASELWMLLSPAGFRTIGTNLADPSARWTEWPAFVARVAAAALIVVGGAQFLGRRPRGRNLLLAGAALEVIVQLLAAVLSIRYRVRAFTSIPAADQIVFSLWQINWIGQRIVLPLLLIVLLTRPHIRTRFAQLG